MNRVLIILLLGFLSLSSVEADTNETDMGILPFIQADVYHIPADASLTQEQWVMARAVKMDGAAQGDLFLFAGAAKLGFSKSDSGLIEINGPVAGNLWAAGQKIEINGPVEHHVRMAGQMIRINNRINGNVLAAATTVSLDTNGIVAESARIMADYFILRGTVDGDLVVHANKVILDGVVKGSAKIRAREISVLSKARLGSLTCETVNQVVPDSKAIIDGPLLVRPPASAKNATLVTFATTFVSYIGAILAGVFFLLFSPRMVVRSTLWMETYPWRTLLVGLAAFVVVPVAAIFLFVSLLGIPLALVISALYGLGLYLGRFIAALSLARLFTGARRRHPMPLPSYRLMLLGLTFFYIASFLPAFLADAIWFWFTITGMGGLIMAARGTPITILPFPPPIPPTRNTDSTTP